MDQELETDLLAGCARSSVCHITQKSAAIWWVHTQQRPLRVHSPDGSTSLREMTVMAAILKVWRQIENPTLSTSIDLHLPGTWRTCNPAKFHPNPIWNDGVLGLGNSWGIISKRDGWCRSHGYYRESDGTWHQKFLNFGGELQCTATDRKTAYSYLS